MRYVNYYIILYRTMGYLLSAALELDPSINFIELESKNINNIHDRIAPAKKKVKTDKIA